jgi:ferredoxin
LEFVIVNQIEKAVTSCCYFYRCSGHGIQLFFTGFRSNSQSISYGEPTTDICNPSNRKGLYRWPVNGEKCIVFWERNHSGSCLNCIRVCPFNKPAGWLHEAVKYGVNHYRNLDRAFLWGDKVFGYGKKHSADEFWDD